MINVRLVNHRIHLLPMRIEWLVKSINQRESASATAQTEIDLLLLHTVIRVESNYYGKALFPRDVESLMRLMLSTERRFNVTNPYVFLEECIS